MTEKEIATTEPETPVSDAPETTKTNELYPALEPAKDYREAVEFLQSCRPFSARLMVEGKKPVSEMSEADRQTLLNYEQAWKFLVGTHKPKITTEVIAAGKAAGLSPLQLTKLDEKLNEFRKWCLKQQKKETGN